MVDVIEKIRQIIEPVINENDMYLDDIIYEQEGDDLYLRVFLDLNEGSLDIDSCAKISEIISNLLDVHDLIKEEYFLEVSSPGLEKPLPTKEKLVSAINEYVFIEFYNQVNGFDNITGYLISLENDEVVVEYLNKNIKKKLSFDYSNIKFARLAVKF